MTGLSQCLRSCRSEFQTWGAKQEKVRKPRVLHLYCWIFSTWVSEEECSVLQSQASGSICMLTIPSTSSRTIAWTHKNVYCTHWYSGSGTVAGMGSTAPRYGCCCTAITTTTTTTITATTTTDQPDPGKVINMSC